MFHNEIEKLSYQLWEERGRPFGSPEEDWFRAERELLREVGPPSSSQFDSPMEVPFLSLRMGPVTE